MPTDGLPAGDTEDLQVYAVPLIFVALHRIVEEPVKQCRVGTGRARYQVPLCSTPPIPDHLPILAHSLLLATQNDGLKFMEMALCILQSDVGVLLLTVDELKHFLAMLISNAGALLPLLDALGQDIIDAAGRAGSKKWNALVEMSKEEEMDE